MRSLIVVALSSSNKKLINARIPPLRFRQSLRSPCRGTPRNQRPHHIPGIRRIRRRRAGRLYALLDVCRQSPSFSSQVRFDRIFGCCIVIFRSRFAKSASNSHASEIISRKPRVRLEVWESFSPEASTFLKWSRALQQTISRALFPPNCNHLISKFKWVSDEFPIPLPKTLTLVQVVQQCGCSALVLNHGQIWSYTEYGLNGSHIQLCSS